jgi:RimJ/RimL family protein N-acetyltransferase
MAVVLRVAGSEEYVMPDPAGTHCPTAGWRPPGTIADPPGSVGRIPSVVHELTAIMAHDPVRITGCWMNAAMLTLQAFKANELRDLMSWFPDRTSCQTWGGLQFRFPFTEETFREDAKVQTLATWSLIDGDGTFCAFGQYYPRLGRCHLGRLAVAPALRGRGVGSTLVRELAQRGLNDLGVDSCSLFVLPGNERAARLYRRLGFDAQPYPVPDPAFDACIYMVAPGLKFGVGRAGARKP